MVADYIAAEGPVRLITVDVSVYGLRPLLKSAYLFTDRAFLHLQYRDECTIEVRFRAKRSDADTDTIARDFLNDLIDQRLREMVAAETESTRDLILAHALSKTSLLNRDLETADPVSDPRHVAKPDTVDHSPV